MLRQLLQIVTLLVCILVHTGATHRSPFTLYHFPAPEFSKLLPFSKTQTEFFRKNGIVEIHLENNKTQTLVSKRNKTISSVSHQRYELDSLGNVKTITWYYCKGKDTVNIYLNVFSYGPNYLARHSYDLICPAHNHDSLAYDSLGRVVYAFSAYRYPSKKSRLSPTDTNYCYALFKSDKNYVALRNTAWNDTSDVIYLNNNSEVYKIKNGMSNDSVSIEETASGLRTKTYWYLSPVSKTYQTGMVQTFKHNLLLKESIFTTHTGEPTEGKETSFFYDDNGQLIKKSTRWPNHTTVYDYEGALLAREYSIDSQGFSKITYRYHYRK